MDTQQIVVLMTVKAKLAGLVSQLLQAQQVGWCTVYLPPTVKLVRKLSVTSILFSDRVCLSHK